MKRHTIGEVARLARVSVRALRHWDEIGLVVPSGRSPKGYRLYTDRDLARLEDVLVHRALGLPLDEIATILGDPSFDRARSLRSHRDALAARIEADRALLALVDRALSEAEGKPTMKPMSPEERLRAFGAFQPEAHEREAQERWGDTAAFEHARRRTQTYGPREWEAIREEREAIEAELAALSRRGQPADGRDAIALAERHRAHLERWFYPCDAELHVALGESYVSDPRFTTYYERVTPGLAVFLRDAILARHGR
jgi:DNA-binding transcriptional MerR regulator